MSKKFNIQHPLDWLATGFGSGLVQPAPGTWGTLAAVPFYLLFADAWQLSALSQLTIVVCGFMAGIYLCGAAAERAGVPDHPAIVWDEFVGFWMTMVWVPFSWLALISGFVLFRAFDIAKPWPISALDKQLHGGLGIMLDDLIAGVFAGGILFLLYDFGLV